MRAPSERSRHPIGRAPAGGRPQSGSRFHPTRPPGGAPPAADAWLRRARLLGHQVTLTSWLPRIQRAVFPDTRVEPSELIRQQLYILPKKASAWISYKGRNGEPPTHTRFSLDVFARNREDHQPHYDRSHLIANSLGGKGDHANILPMLKTFNDRMLERVERPILNRVQYGDYRRPQQVIHYEVEAEFGGQGSANLSPAEKLLPTAFSFGVQELESALHPDDPGRSSWEAWRPKPHNQYIFIPPRLEHAVSWPKPLAEPGPQFGAAWGEVQQLAQSYLDTAERDLASRKLPRQIESREKEKLLPKVREVVDQVLLRYHANDYGTEPIEDVLDRELDWEFSGLSESWFEMAEAYHKPREEGAAGHAGGATGAGMGERDIEFVVASVGDDAKTVVPGLYPGESYVAGRAQVAASSTAYPWVSREHLRFENREGALYVTLTGLNPTFLNGMPMTKGTPVPLRSGVHQISLSGTTPFFTIKL